MRLAELPVGTSILFDVSIQKQELEFPSEVVEVHDNFILTKPVMSKGKVVGLGGEGVSVSLTYSRNDKAPIVWKGVGCSVVKTKGRVLYKVIASGAGFEVNRREAFRLFVGLEGIARVGLCFYKKVPGWYKIVSVMIAVLVFVSTLVTKQHVIVDVIGGVAVAELTWFVSCRTNGWKIYRNLVRKAGGENGK